MPISSRQIRQIENNNCHDADQAEGNVRDSTQRLTNKEKLCFSVGHIQNDLQAFAALSYILLFLTKVVGLQNQSTGTIFLVAQVTDGILSPLLGFLCDRFNFPGLTRFGKRKAWHMFGVIILFLFSPFLFVRCLACELADNAWRESIAVGYYSFIVIAIHFGFATVQISHLALLPDIAQKPSDHVKLNSFRTAWTFVSGVFVYGVFWLLLGKSTGEKITSKNQNQFMYLQFIIVGVGLVFTVIFYAGVNENKIKERQLDQAETVPVSTASTVNPAFEDETEHTHGPRTSQSTTRPIKNSQEQISPNDFQINSSPSNDGSVVVEVLDPSNTENVNKQSTVNDVSHQEITGDGIKANIAKWFRRPKFFMVGFVYMCSRVVLNISSAYFPFYLEESLNFEKEAVAYFPLLVLVSSILFSWVAKKISSHWNTYVAFCIAALMTIGAFHWLHFLPIGFKNAVYGASVMMGGGVAMMLVSALTMVAMLIDSKDKSTGAFVYGVMSLTDKVANGILVHLVQKYKPEQQMDGSCPGCGKYMRLVFPLVTGAAAFLSMLVAAVLLVAQRKQIKPNGHLGNGTVVCTTNDAAIPGNKEDANTLHDVNDTRL